MELPIHYQEVENIYANSCGRGIRSLAICSAEPGEGVSTVAYALARRSEAGGHRTLLVDLNLHRPNLSLRGTPQRQAWSDPGSTMPLVREAPDAKFALLPAPPATQSLLPLRERDVIARHLHAWLMDFDTVILDTSPINSVNRGNVPADIVCGSCDGTILVVLAGKTSTTAVKQACGTLHAAGAKLVGTVLNDRFNPSLVSELCRETHRMDHKWPRTMSIIRAFVQRSTLLTHPI